MNKRDTARRQTVEAWLESYGSRLYGLMQVYLGPELAELPVFEQLVIEVFQDYRDVSRSESVFSALLPIALGVYREAARRAEGESRQSHDTRGEDNVPDTMASPDVTHVPAQSTPVQWPDAIANVHRLPVEQRDVLCAWLCEEPNMRAVESVLLRPWRWIHERLADAVASVCTESLTPVEALAKTPELRLELGAVLDSTQISEECMTRVLQVLWAVDERARAEQRNRGSVWMRYGIAGVLVLSAVAIGYGAYRPRVGSNAAPVSSAVGAVSGLPPVLSNFPGAVVAQYRLPDSFKQLGLDHMAVGADGVYLPKLNVSTDTWPFIEVNKCSFGDSGRSLTDRLQQVAKIEMIPPVSQAKRQSASNQNWTVHDWKFDVTGTWSVVQITWQEPGRGSAMKTQLYLLYLPSGKSNLVMTLDSPTPQDIHSIAVGDGKVAIQSAVHGSGAKSALTQPLGSPINVYTLAGTVPLKAMGEPKQIAAPFGLVVAPSVIGDTLVFQGIQGKTPELDNANAVWYGLTWDGQVSRYTGPPVDGQPHWVVKGASANLWWAETTPDPVKPQDTQVLFSPLTGVTQVGESPATTLGGVVQLFTTSGQYVAWVQNLDGVTQLVVGLLH